MASTPSFTKRDYEALASLLKPHVIKAEADLNWEALHALTDLVWDMADHFEEWSSRFDHEKFLLACGVLPKEEKSG
jgi:hypothetical protein